MKGLIIALLVSFAAASVHAGPGVTLQGQLLKPDGSPVRTSVEFRLQVRTPGAENCLLYEETQTKDLSLTDGVFVLTLNDGSATTQVNTFGFERIFQNNKPFNFSAGSCAGGPLYSPNALDDRRLEIAFRDGTFSGWEALPSQKIGYTPMAIESTSVGGYGAGNLLRVDGAAIQALTAVQHNTLLDLINGTGSQYLRSTSVLDGSHLQNGSVTDTAIVSLSWPKIAGVPASLSQIGGLSCPDGQILKVSSGVWTCATESSGGVTSVSAMSPLTSSGGSTPQISIAQATAGNDGYLSKDDWSAFNAKQAALGFVPVDKAGDSMTGSLRIAGSVQIGMDAASCGGTKAGTLRYNAGNVEYCNGVSWVAFGIGGAGLMALNGSTQSSQSFANPGTVGLAPNWSTNAGAGIHTLNIPMASGSSVSAGLISKTEYDLFNSKLGVISGAATLANGKIWIGDSGGKAQELAPGGDVLMTNAGGFTVAKLQGRSLASTPPSLGTFLKWNNTLSQWEPSAFANCNGATQVMHYTSITDTWSCDTLTANGLLPAQISNAGKYLTTDGNTVSWANIAAAGANGQVQFNNSGIPGASSSLFWDNTNTRLGIGTSTPNQSLTIVGNGAGVRPAINLTGYNVAPTIFGVNAAGAPASPTPTSAGAFLLLLSGDGFAGGTSWPSQAARIALKAASLWSASNSSTYITFETTANGTYNTPVERMRIDSEGNIGIGITNPGYRLDVSGDINASGSVRSTGVALSSDIRYKRDIEVIDDSLEKILTLHGVSYHWRADEFPEKHFNDRPQIGVIAQEVEKQFPEAVDTDKEGYKAVNYPALVAPLIEAVKTLSHRLTDLQTAQDREIASLKADGQVKDEKIEKLERENAEMKARLDKIEEMMTAK